jgi:hypothetical protein
MSTDHRTTPRTRTPMDPMRKTALVAGVLYLITFVTSIPALPLYHNILNDKSYLLHAGSDTGVLLAAFLEVICALAGIGTAVTLFRVAKRQSETAALAFVTARVLEAAMIFVGVLSVLSIVTLHQHAVPGADAASLVTNGRSLVAIHDWTFLFGPGLMPAVNALCLGYVMYKSRLVPRIIPIVGLIGAPLLIASAIAILFGHLDQVSPLSGLITFPIAAWEFSLGVWLTFKGFKPSPLTADVAPTDWTLDGPRVPAVA